MIRRAGWGLADQALSSLTNFALGILLARSLGPADFGAFGIAFATYAVVLNVGRALATDPLLVRFGGRSGPEWRNATTAATGMSIVIGALASLPCLLIGLVATGALRDSFVSLALILPGLLLQDSWRFAFFCAGRDAMAFANDAIWAIALLALFVIAMVGAGGSLLWLMLAWGVAATVAGALGILQSRVIPDVRRSLGWWRQHVDIAPRFAGQYLISMAATQASIYALGVLGGLGQVGALRAAQLLLGPLNILFQGIGLIAVPEGVAILRFSSRRLVRLSIILSVLLSVAALAWGSILLMLPTTVGTMILGTNWELARTLVLPLTLGLAAMSATFGAAVILRAVADAKRSLRATTEISLLQVVGGVGGAAMAGASGVAWGTFAANGFGAVGWWSHARRGLEAHRRRSASGPG